MNRQEHLLTIIGEECNEVAQRCAKAMRFGLEEVQEGQSLTNADRIFREFEDLLGSMSLLFPDFYKRIEWQNVIEKRNKIEKWLLYSSENGTLKD